MKPLFIIYTTEDFSGLPIGLKIMREGFDVLFALIEPEIQEKYWHQPKNKSEQEKHNRKYEMMQKTAENAINREWAAKVTQRLLSRKKEFINDVYILFDYIAGYKYGEQLREAGFKVLGGSKVGYDLEINREQTQGFLERLGFEVPKVIKFGANSADKGIKYLTDKQDELYAFKSDNPNLSTSVAENSNQEIIIKIEAEKNLVNSAPFILQERIIGYEGNIETYYSMGKPVMCNVDFEVKKKYNDISPVQCGCAYDLVFTIPLNSDFRIIANAPFDDFMKKNLPTGRMDLSFIYSPGKKKFYTLEVCGDRFGYNQVFTLLSTLNIPVGIWFMGLLNGDYAYHIESAVAIVNGKRYEGKSHYHALEAAKKAGEPMEELQKFADNQEELGLFKTSQGKLITRQEADTLFGIDHSHQIPQLSLFEGFGASLRVFNSDKEGGNLIEFSEGFQDNIWMWGFYDKDGKHYSTATESTAILTAKGENPESAFAKVKEVYDNYYNSAKWCRDDFQNTDKPNLPIARYHFFRGLGMY